MSKPNRVFTAEFRVEVAKADFGRGKRLQAASGAGDQAERFVPLARRLRQGRYCRSGSQIGRPPGVPNPSTPKPGVSAEETLRSEIATLQRKVGKQAMQLDFFARAFRRIKESSRNSSKTGATASTERSVQ